MFITNCMQLISS